MTSNAASIAQTVFLIQMGQQESQPITLQRLRFQPWLKLSIAFICLALGVRLLGDPRPQATIVALALLVRVPGYWYLGLCNFRALREARVALALGSYLQGYRRAPAAPAAWASSSSAKYGRVCA
jgi:hypothetical protein